MARAARMQKLHTDRSRRSPGGVSGLNRPGPDPGQTHSWIRRPRTRRRWESHRVISSPSPHSTDPPSPISTPGLSRLAPQAPGSPACISPTLRGRVSLPQQPPSQHTVTDLPSPGSLCGQDCHGGQDTQKGSPLKTCKPQTKAATESAWPESRTQNRTPWHDCCWTLPREHLSSPGHRPGARGKSDGKVAENRDSQRLNTENTPAYIFSPEPRATW